MNKQQSKSGLFTESNALLRLPKVASHRHCFRRKKEQCLLNGKKNQPTLSEICQKSLSFNMPFSPNEPNEETRNRTSHLICQCFVFPPQINPLGTRRGNEKILRPPSNPGSRDDHLEQQEKSSRESRQVQCLDEVEEGMF
ncbi:hypothetical protein TNCV_4172551 [Trichonephila clavipes]|nr:hypothetical protein TNCV_4172551 [Trichonephila clavipes]